MSGRLASAALGVWLLWTGAAAAAGAADVAGGVAAPAPMGLETLGLTPLQQRILSDVFAKHAFQTPEPPPPDADFGVLVEPTVPGGVYRRGPGGDLPARLRVAVRKVGVPAAARFAYRVDDFYGRKVAEGTLEAVQTDALGLAAADLVLRDLFSVGYYHVYVSATSVDRRAEGACGIAVVDAAEGGERPESPFGVALAEAPPDGFAEACRRLGAARVAVTWADERSVANLPPGGPPPADWRPEFDWAAGDQALAAVRAADLAVTGILDPGRLAARFLGPQGPAAGAGEADAAGVRLPVLLGAACVEHYGKGIPDWQIGGTRFLEPGGWPAPKSGPVPGGAEAYRQMVAGLIAEVRATRAPAALWVSATPEFMGDVLSEATALKDADGVSLVVEAGGAGPTLRSGAYRRSLDFGIQTARRFGLRRAVVGATGEGPDAASPQRQAWRLVARHVLALAAGAERVYVTYGRGVPAPLPAAAAYARMVDLLGGAKYDADLWPDAPLVEAHLFSSARRRVVVLWSWAGDDPAAPDRGALVLENGFGLEAFDVVGRPVGLWKGRRLIVPLGEAPVFLVTTILKANEVRDRLRRVQIVGTAPAALWVRGLEPGDRADRVKVRLWVQSQRPYRVDATAALLLPAGWTTRQAKQRFGIDPGEVREAVFDCDLAKDAAPPPCRIEAVLEADGAWTRRAQQVQPAWIPRRTIRVGFGLSDWEGIAPVRLEGGPGQAAAEVRAAYDGRFFYFAAQVARDRGSFLSAANGYGGDAIQLGFGLRPRADDDFGHRSRGLPAGAFRDTDHLMAITLGEVGAQVVRLRGTQVVLRTHREENLDPWFGPVEGAEASIVFDASSGTTIYEAAIPLAALAPLKGERGQALRFAFRIGSGGPRPLDWAQVAGTPDYLANPASFLPTSDADALPCQTRWVLTGPAPGAKQP